MKKKRNPQDSVVRNVSRLRAEVRENKRMVLKFMRTYEKSLGKLSRAHAELADHVDVVAAAIDTRFRLQTTNKMR